IVLENDHAHHFMTEKISDAFLGWSYPIYFGGSEAYHQFPAGSFSAIDIYQPEQALATIRDCLEAHTYESSLAELAAARQAVLMKNNLFARLADYWRANLSRQAASRVTLLPKCHRAGLMFKQLGRSVCAPLARDVA
ncbi:MAG: hypothetical protein KDA45_15155, partial [Planctomycetales bacterium]|nr:hypothetical protein [Planctomycetales bacterium]